MPLPWAVYRHQELFRSRNNLECGECGLPRLLLVPALAYWLLAAVGLHAARHSFAELWCSSSKPRSCSLLPLAICTICRTPLECLRLPSRRICLIRAVNQLRREVPAQDRGQVRRRAR